MQMKRKNMQEKNARQGNKIIIRVESKEIIGWVKYMKLPHIFIYIQTTLCLVPGIVHL